MNREFNRMINELNMLKGDIESSEVKQVIPFINGRISTQSPKEHLIQHCNNLEQYIALHSNTITQQEKRIAELQSQSVFDEQQDQLIKQIGIINQYKDKLDHIKELVINYFFDKDIDANITLRKLKSILKESE